MALHNAVAVNSLVNETYHLNGFAESWQSSNQGTSLSLATALHSQMKSTI